ncbi:hypothetical protein ACFL4O_03810 [bacterium]
MSYLSVSSVKTKSELDEFINLPWEIYKYDAHWVPPLISEVKYLLSEQNPFWTHADCEHFILKKGNETVGRISAVIDYNYQKVHNEKVGFFGFYESYDNEEHSAILLNTVKEWLKSRNVSKMFGPVNPSTNDEMGFLMDGFFESPKLMMPYNPPYYLSLMEAYGLVKIKDLYAFIVDVKNAPFEKLEKVTSFIKRKNKKVNVRPIDLKNFNKDIKNALSIYNEAWELNWGFVPWTEEEFFDTAKKLKAMLFRDTTLFVEIDGEPAGMLIGVPDYNEVIKKLNGKLNLFNIIKFLFYKKRIKGLRVMILGVKQQFRKKGLEALLYLEAAKNAHKAGFTHSEMSWVLEDNALTNSAVEMLGGKIYKRYRVYQCDIV